MHDIVIPLRRAIVNEELRYTLRAICKNFPHRTVWLSGYYPSWVTEAGRIDVTVPQAGKYVKAANNILTACRDPRVSEEFYLFNDDFYPVKSIENFEDMHRGPLIDRIKTFKNSGIKPGYAKGLERTYNILRRMGFDNPMDYTLHVPMFVSKKRWLEAWKAQLKHNPDRRMVSMRTFYGNYYQIGGKQMKDVKLIGLKQKPTGEEEFLSSNIDSFNQGLIGEYLRHQFKDPCKYEH